MGNGMIKVSYDDLIKHFNPTKFFCGGRQPQENFGGLKFLGCPMKIQTSKKNSEEDFFREKISGPKKILVGASP